MRKITDIYKEYKIINNLQEHQFRVTGVAMQICESFDLEIDKESIIKACLVHDLGNIIKFRLNYFPEFLEPEGLEYWQSVQNEFIQKYGDNEHEGTLKILAELGVSPKITRIVSVVGYPYIKEVLESDDLNKKIITYSDFRVSPHGVVSIAERAEDGRKRYEGFKNDVTPDERERRFQYIVALQSQIFSHLKIKPEDITDDSITKNIEKLKNFEI
jgi:hypothetical protein